VKEEWSHEMIRLESVRHPNIVYIHDAFEDNFLFYFALEKCDTNLKALLGRPLQDPFIIEIARQLLMTLQYLHDSGVVHADLHAGNVLLSQLDRAPIVKLTDFGVAQVVDRQQRWFRPQVANPKILTPELVTLGYTTDAERPLPARPAHVPDASPAERDGREPPLPRARAANRGGWAPPSRPRRSAPRWPGDRQDAPPPRRLPVPVRARGLGRSPPSPSLVSRDHEGAGPASRRGRVTNLREAVLRGLA
jgi:serine/threonine protein kinase